ncbi:MAG: dipicolinate synthase subunit DpsA [Bacillota bacterium]
MASGPGEYSITVAGGDERQLAVVRVLVEGGFQVRLIGLGKGGNMPVFYGDTWQEALDGASLLLLPISGVSLHGEIKTVVRGDNLFLDDEFWRYIPEQTVVLTGSWPCHLRKNAAAKNLRVFEYAEMDEIAVPNAIPTAEGALQIAINELPITIHGSNVLILGFGRVAVAAARLFASAGASVYIAARRPEARAIATLSGYRGINLPDLKDFVGRMDLIINSIPSLVLTRNELEHVSRDSLIVDLASAPGGVDFMAAKEFGVKAVLALGLPGKVAPKTAGQILASTLPAMIRRILCLP